MSEAVLKIEGLRVGFETRNGFYPAIEGIDLELFPGETLGVVGESGCGKSVTALSVLRLLPEPPARIEKGVIELNGEDLLQASLERLRKVRGRDIAMIFQEPMTSLNPVLRVGRQIEEVLEVHTDLDRKARHARVLELLNLVGLAAPERRARTYPHELSGGMRQRVMIAMALACDPTVLIADEPTTALDVTVQAQILDLIDGLKRKSGMAVLLITHDLGVVAEYSQRVAVMYAGRVVEMAPVVALFAAPRHPYTEGLIRALPVTREGHRRPLQTIPGVVPDLASRPSGCSFRARCPRALPRCAAIDPALEPIDAGHEVACHNPVPLGERAR